jgi:di/tricarboxylate transporter
MSYTEIGIIYSLPLILILIGTIYLLYYLCQRRTRRFELGERKKYRQQRKMTWHVFVLSITFILLWLPWISIRILIIFYNIPTIQRSLQIAYYILILKSAIFPILYASTNASFRGSFAIYRRQRITMNNRVWTVNNNLEHSLERRRGY